MQEKSAYQGIELLSALSKAFHQEGGNFQFMPGGGISDSNLKEILEKTGCREFHASARIEKKSEMRFKNEKCKMGTDSSEYSIHVTSKEKVMKLVQIHKDLYNV